MKVLCIGDSLALPGHGNMYEDTWFYKLKKEFTDYDFVSYFQRSLTTNVLNTSGLDKNGVYGADCLELYEPQIVVLQLGIVDCAPRLIYEDSKVWKYIQVLPSFFVTKYVKYLKKTKGRDPKNVYVKPNEFENNLIRYFDRCAPLNLLKVIYIAIPYPDKEMVDKNPRILENVNKYNQIVNNLQNNYHFLNVIFPLDCRNKTNLYDDGYHPNSNGNEEVFCQLRKFFNLNNLTF